MGAAMDWLSESERESLAQELLPKAKVKGGRVTASCPFHNENTPSFGYSPALDVYHCFGCRASGDLIKLWGHQTGQGDDEAGVFRAFKAKYGPAAGAEGPRPRDRRTVRQRPEPRPALDWEPAELEKPPDLWLERATLFAQHSAERLQGNARELARLAGYGLDAYAAGTCRLGWNDAIKVFPCSSWGLAKDGDIKLYPGLTIPLYEDGQVIKIKIRRPDGSQPRFMMVEGSCMRLSIYGKTDTIMVVEGERDAAMLWCMFGWAGWSILATGSASARPCAQVHQRLSAAKVLAVSLDADKAGAGAWLDFWRKTYPRAFQWLLPRAWGLKDPGEAVQAGYDLSPWMAEALVYARFILADEKRAF